MIKIKNFFVFFVNFLIIFLIGFFLIKYSLDNANFDFNCRDNKQIILELKKKINYHQASQKCAENIADRLQRYGINNYKISIIGDDKIKVNFVANDTDDYYYINRLLTENCHFVLSNNENKNIGIKTILIDEKWCNNAYINVASDYRNIYLILPFSKYDAKDVKELFIQTRKQEKKYKNNKNIFFTELNKNEKIAIFDAKDLYYKNKKNSIQIRFDLNLARDDVKKIYKRIFFYKTLLNSKNFQHEFEIVDNNFVEAINKRFFNYNDVLTNSNLVFFVIFLFLLVFLLLLKAYKLKKSLMIIFNLIAHLSLTIFVFVFLKRTFDLSALIGLLLIFLQSILINIFYNNIFFKPLLNINNNEKVEFSKIKKIFLNSNNKLFFLIFDISLFSAMLGTVFYFISNKATENVGILLVINCFTNFITNYLLIKKNLRFFIKTFFLNFAEHINTKLITASSRIVNYFSNIKTEKKKNFFRLIFMTAILLNVFVLSFNNKAYESNKYEVCVTTTENKNLEDFKNIFQEILKNIKNLNYNQNSIYAYHNEKTSKTCLIFDIKSFDAITAKKYSFNKKNIIVNGDISTVIKNIFEKKFSEKVDAHVRKISKLEKNFNEKLTELLSFIGFFLLLFALYLLIIKKRKLISILKTSLVFLIIALFNIANFFLISFNNMQIALCSSIFLYFLILCFLEYFETNSYTENINKEHNYLYMAIPWFFSFLISSLLFVYTANIIFLLFYLINLILFACVYNLIISKFYQFDFDFKFKKISFKKLDGETDEIVFKGIND
ncbi:MAG: hypothetical protein J6Y70_00220 [Bacilli bacterium]|nr:hypothetical protein [Bacilli bacterium]